MHPAALGKPQPAMRQGHPGQRAGLRRIHRAQQRLGQAQRRQAGVPLGFVCVKTLLNNPAGVPILASAQLPGQLAQAVGIAGQ